MDYGREVRDSLGIGFSYPNVYDIRMYLRLFALIQRAERTP